jgi:hypothetical protein
MTASPDSPGQHNAVLTQDHGKTASSEDLSEKGVIATDEFAQGHVVSIFNARVASLTCLLTRYPASTTTPTGLAMESTLPVLIPQRLFAKWTCA